MAEKTTENTTVETAVFTKEQLKESRKYRKDKDILSVVLEKGKSYTISEVDTLIKQFKERKVK